MIGSHGGISVPDAFPFSSSSFYLILLACLLVYLLACLLACLYDIFRFFELCWFPCIIHSFIHSFIHPLLPYIFYIPFHISVLFSHFIPPSLLFHSHSDLPYLRTGVFVQFRTIRKRDCLLFVNLFTHTPTTHLLRLLLCEYDFLPLNSA